jgi:GTP cyclohydrolase III
VLCFGREEATITRLQIKLNIIDRNVSTPLKQITDLLKIGMGVGKRPRTTLHHAKHDLQVLRSNIPSTDQSGIHGVPMVGR